MSTVSAHIDHILAIFHEKEWRLLAELDAQVSRSSDKRLTAPWRHLHDTLAAHMQKEEQVLFPAMRAMEAGQPGMDFRIPLQVMQHEHETLGTLEIAMRSAARDAGELEEPLLELLDDLGQHAAFEEEVLFPAALALFEREAEAPVRGPAPRPVDPGRPAPKRATPKHGPVAGLRARAQGVRSRIRGLWGR